MPPPSKTRTRAALRDLALGASVEVLAGQLPPPEVLAGHLPRGAAVYVPFPPKGRWPDTVAACQRVLAAGMKPVPHLPARSVRSPDELGDWLAALVETGVNSLMLVAGDRAAPAGPYPDTPALLDSGLLAEQGLRRLGVTSYPEGHPLIGPADLDEALRRKTAYARATGAELWVVTQFVFSPAPALAWLARKPEFLKAIRWHRPPGTVKFMWVNNLTVTKPEDRCRHSVDPFRSDFKGAGAGR